MNLGRYIKFRDPEKAAEQLSSIRQILEDETSEIGPLLQNLIDFSLQSEEVREEAKQDCIDYFLEAPMDIGVTGYGGYIDMPLFSAYALNSQETEFMENILPEIEREAIGEISR